MMMGVESIIKEANCRFGTTLDVGTCQLYYIVYQVIRITTAKPNDTGFKYIW